MLKTEQKYFRSCDPVALDKQTRGLQDFIPWPKVGGGVSEALKIFLLVLKFCAFWAWINTSWALQYFLDCYYVLLMLDKFIFDVYRIFQEDSSDFR